MDSMFPEATVGDLLREPSCPMCREQMVRACRLPCNHVFHHHCLLRWLQRQPSCPMCRVKLPGLQDLIQPVTLDRSWLGRLLSYFETRPLRPEQLQQMVGGGKERKKERKKEERKKKERRKKKKEVKKKN